MLIFKQFMQSNFPSSNLYVDWEQFFNYELGNSVDRRGVSFCLVLCFTKEKEVIM